MFAAESLTAMRALGFFLRAAIACAAVIGAGAGAAAAARGIAVVEVTEFTIMVIVNRLLSLELYNFRYAVSLGLR